MPEAIAIVGMACRFPGAHSPAELWENVLAQRQAFRRIPAERLRLEDYFAADPSAEDRIYSQRAAVLEGWEFDRERFRVSGDAFRSSDMAHWLALDVASLALADAGLGGGERLPRRSTAVYLGNTLTGESSRANSLRLRWPYVRRASEAALIAQGLPEEVRSQVLAALESNFKAPFPATGDETLAGSLSNTIAGRICNYYDLHGGGYTVDGACASSLLAVANACAALRQGTVDAALAGGVDLSLDPFELVGFAKAGALAKDRMLVYDERSDGFIPGEGCGLVVLLRERDAVAAGLRLRALIRGWGISSDGSGGLTRPDAEGQRLAIERAWQCAQRPLAGAAYFEGHGTGTAVGDAAELTALTRAREAAGAEEAAAIGSVKALIGHCKAAAGIAGLIKAAMALEARHLPPTAGCERPHKLLGRTVRVLRSAEPWPEGRAMTAGVSAMGFGGINAHVVLESAQRASAPQHRRVDRGVTTNVRTTGFADSNAHIVTDAAGSVSAPQDTERFVFSAATEPELLRQAARVDALGSRQSAAAEMTDGDAVAAETADTPAVVTRRDAIEVPRQRRCVPQDAELFVFSAATEQELLGQVACVEALAPLLSAAELTDLAAELARQVGPGDLRAAIVAATPEELAAEVAKLRAAPPCRSAGRPRIGLLFPGQGSPAHSDGGVWRHRFEAVETLYAGTAGHTGVATEVVQPAIVRASVAALHVLSAVGLTAEVAVGHSLGELMALHWAGAVDEAGVLALAVRRGAAMSDAAIPEGAMAAVTASPTLAQSLIESERVHIAGFNSPSQTVLSGAASDVDAVVRRARQRQIPATRIPVSHAFHSPLMTSAAEVFGRELQQHQFRPRVREVASTVTGALLNGHDLRELLVRQITAPVRFMDAVQAAGPVDLWIECGPGTVLTKLVRESGAAAVATDACGNTLRALLEAVGAAFAQGAPVCPAALFTDRFTRPFPLDRRLQFLANPCEHAPAGEATPVRTKAPAATSAASTQSPLETLRQVAAAHAELPVSAVTDDSRMLSDLHLNSIVVGRIVADACTSLGLPVPLALTEFADASVAAIAGVLEASRQAERPRREHRHPAGVGTWVRTFRKALIEKPLPVTARERAAGAWEVMAAPGDPRCHEVHRALTESGAHGVVVLLPDSDGAVPLLLRAAKAVLHAGAGTRFVLVQSPRGAASFARTLHFEAPQIATRIVSIAQWSDRAPAWIAAEAAHGGAFVEAEYDAGGRRFQPALEHVPGSVPSAPPLTSEDLLLITGGGKGIAAECGLALARSTGVRLALMGRARPEDDAELAANLQRIQPAAYLAADVTDAEAVERALRDLPVTAVLHGAGANTPRLISQLSEEDFRRTLAPKVDGLRNVLRALDADRLRLLIGFGSIIAQTGLRGEADYAVANEWLARAVDDWGAQYPHCRTLTAEWSVWSGVGMGERLGRIETLLEQGITPISPDQGVAALLGLLTKGPVTGAVTVAGRFGLPPTAPMKSTLPFRRYLQNVRVHYPGVELVADANILEAADPHIRDHEYHGQPLFAAVMGLEAMAQVAMALAGWQAAPVFEDVRLERPVSCPATIRMAALLREDGAVDVVLRSSETGFQVDHFAAVCRPASSAPEVTRSYEPGLAVQDLYESLLFQRGRYQRVRSYPLLRARECAVEIESRQDTWFDRYAPVELELGDPGARDAMLHSVQACIPHHVLLPLGAGRIGIFDTAPCSRTYSHARERSSDGSIFVYDVEVFGENGRIRERWEGLRLKAVETRTTTAGLPEWLVPVYLERRMLEAAPSADTAIALTAKPGEHGAVHRPDGKPDGPVSYSYCGPYRLSVNSSSACGCDIETAAAAAGLLDEARTALAREIAAAAGEPLGTAATRVWGALECLKKAGFPCDAPLALRRTRPLGAMELVSGTVTIVSCALQLPAVAQPAIATIAIQAGVYAANL